jgi:protein-L-isoaspartate(D-aspartate) O-methyltransferase
VNAHVLVGDGTRGLPEHAPYDAIIVAAAFPDVPAPLVEQLVEGGRLVQPIGRGGNEDVVLFEKREDALASIRVLTGARFVRLIGSYGFRP